MGRRCADIYLADKIKEPVKEEKKKAETITLPKQELQEKVGNYQDERFGTWMTISMKDEKLRFAAWGSDMELVLLSKTTFQALNPWDEEITVEFLPDAKGKTTRANINIVGIGHQSIVRVAPLAPLTPAQLKEYAGEYVSEELLNARCKFVVDKDSLILKFRSTPPGPFKAMGQDKFTQGIINIDFVRTGNKVTGFRLTSGWVSGIEFVKK